MSNFFKFLFALFLPILFASCQPTRELDITSSFSKYYGMEFDEPITAAKFSPTGDIFFAATIQGYGDTSSALLVTKTINSGDIEWSRILSTSNDSYGINLESTSGGGILISAVTMGS